MSQPSPFGTPVQDDPTGEVPAAASTDGPPEKKTRIGLLAVAGTGVVAGAAVIGFLLMSGTSDEDLGYTGPIAQAPNASATAAPSPSPTPLPTESTVNARNPFLAAPAATKAAAGGTGSGQAAPAPNSGSVPTAQPAPTAKPSPATPQVLVALVDFDADTYQAKFQVQSPSEKSKTKITWTVVPGDDFGKPLSTGSSKPFLYNGVVTLTSGRECTSVKFVDAPAVQVCEKDIIQVQ